MSDFCCMFAVVGTKPHQCTWCRKDIQIGERHMRVFGKQDGELYWFRSHCECDEVTRHWPDRYWEVHWDPMSFSDELDLYRKREDIYAEVPDHV